MTDAGTTARRDPPGQMTRLGVMVGFAKVDVEHLWWIDEVTQDAAWVRKASVVRMLPVLVPYLVLGSVTSNWGFLVGAVLGVVLVQFIAVVWTRKRLVRSIRNLHGIGDKRSFWADWSPAPYAAFNGAMVLAVVGIAAVVFAGLDDDVNPKVIVGMADCVSGATTLDLDVIAFNRTDAPQRVVVDFRYVEPTGTVVTVPAVATITPNGRQEVVATVEVPAAQGCFGVGATVRSDP